MTWRGESWPTSLIQRSLESQTRTMQRDDLPVVTKVTVCRGKETINRLRCAVDCFAARATTTVARFAQDRQFERAVALLSGHDRRTARPWPVQSFFLLAACAPEIANAVLSHQPQELTARLSLRAGHVSGGAWNCETRKVASPAHIEIAFSRLSLGNGTKLALQQWGASAQFASVEQLLCYKYRRRSVDGCRIRTNFY